MDSPRPSYLLKRGVVGRDLRGSFGCFSEQSLKFTVNKLFDHDFIAPVSPKPHLSRGPSQHGENEAGCSRYRQITETTPGPKPRERGGGQEERAGGSEERPWPNSTVTGPSERLTAHPLLLPGGSLKAQCSPSTQGWSSCCKMGGACTPPHLLCRKDTRVGAGLSHCNFTHV